MEKVIRAVAWIKRFLQNCRIKLPTSKTIMQTELTKELTSEEESAGELKLLQLIQSENFSEEITSLQNKRVLNGHFKKLDVFIDDHGLIRVGGRLKHDDFPYASKHQVILPAKHDAIILLVKHYHRQQHHVGREHLMSILRQRFWIIGGRVMCKQVIRSCVVCQKTNAKPTFTKMADLPADRITSSLPPFYHVGVDYFGPITVKVLRSRVKRWGCIFTCLTSRAVHLEVAPSLESDDFINVLERFVCRRGHPKLIRSDCGTNFKGATNELKKEIEKMDQMKIDESLRRKQIKWEFNPPESPHMGGVWERMVRSVKTSLHAILLDDTTVLNDFTLMTCLLYTSPSPRDRG